VRLVEVEPAYATVLELTVQEPAVALITGTSKVVPAAVGRTAVATKG
jgi:hypothetical protein